MDLSQIIDKWPKEMRLFANGEICMIDLPKDLDYELYLCYMEDMPYGTQKARTGDPYEFIEEALFNDSAFTSLIDENQGG